MDDVHSEKDAEHFRHVASPREGLIKHRQVTILNRSSSETPQMMRALLASRLKPPVVRCIMHQWI